MAWFAVVKQSECLASSRGRTVAILQNQEKHSRSIAKAPSCRVTGTIDTFVISAIVTGKLGIAGSIAVAELFTRIALYYFHERAWIAVP
jgi:uncharacterized membrane protein